MTFISGSQPIFLLLLIIYCTVESNANRHRRQIIDGANPNVRVPQQRFDGPIPLNDPNRIVSNERNNPQQSHNTNPLIVAPPPQIEIVRSHGFYNNPSFQPSPFTGEKPLGWFGTNRVNWVSNKDSELDKNKLAAEKHAPAPNNPQTAAVQPPRQDGGPFFLEKVAKQYGTKGENAFPIGPLDAQQGHGSMCSNHENIDGFVFGVFVCPLPASTGMSQLDQFCCGLANYQYCCNAQEFSQSQRGAFSDDRFLRKQLFPTGTDYSSLAKRRLSIIAPIASFIVLIGIISLAGLYYKKFRKEQDRIGRPEGAVRLEDDYIVISQEPPVEKPIYSPVII